MKKFLVVALLFGLLVSMASAQQLIGAKASGMGGAGVANVTDLASVYYNPAALMESNVKAGEVKIALGAAYSKPDKLIDAMSKASDPATFLLDNYANDLTFSGSLNGIVGLNIRKIGLSVLPMVMASVSKPALSTGGTVNAMVRYDTVVTVGTNYSVPFLPIGEVAVGANIKSIAATNGSITANVSPDPRLSSGNKTIQTGSGVGFDIGALASLDVPMVTSFKAGIVMRDLGESIKYTNKSQFSYINQITGKVTFDAEVQGADTTQNINSSTAIGASAVVPGIGLVVAGDIEMANPDTNIHMGVEYPMLLGMIILRAGVASGPNLGLTTIGAKLNLPIMGLDLAMISNSKQTDLSSMVVDINIGF